MALIVQMTSVHDRLDVRIFLKECRCLVQEGHTVILLVADGREFELRDGVRIESVRAAKGRLGRMVVVPPRLLWKALGLKADLYHLHDPELIPMGLLLKARGARVVFDAHEDLPRQIFTKTYLPMAVRWILSRVASAFLRFTLPWLDGLVAATPTIRDGLLPINSTTIAVNNYPIMGELASGPRSAPPDRFICYVGGISASRGIVELVSALAFLPGDIRLQLAGSFENPAIEQSVKAMEGWRRVDYFGEIDRAGIRNVMARSMVGIVTLHPTPNYLDSLPVKMFEYMSAGLAVVASRFPLWQDILGEGPCGLCVDPRDPKAVADAIWNLVSQPELALAMGRHGQKAVRERFNWEVESLSLGAHYKSILTGKGRSSA